MNLRFKTFHLVNFKPHLESQVNWCLECYVLWVSEMCSAYRQVRTYANSKAWIWRSSIIWRSGFLVDRSLVFGWIRALFIANSALTSSTVDCRVRLPISSVWPLCRQASQIRQYLFCQMVGSIQTQQYDRTCLDIGVLQDFRVCMPLHNWQANFPL